MITRWYQDSEFMRLFDATAAFPRTASKWQKWYDGLADTKDEYHFTIWRLNQAEKTASSMLIGWTFLDGSLWNNRTGWVALAIVDPADRGKGYGTDTLQIVLKFAFHEINLHRVQLSVFSYNTPAIRLYEKVGFVQEGVQHEFGQRN